MSKEKDTLLTSTDLIFYLDWWKSSRGIVAKMGDKEFNVTGIDMENLTPEGNIILTLTASEKQMLPIETYLVEHAIRNLKAGTLTTFTQVVYKDRAIVSITKTRAHSSSKGQVKYYYETTVDFVYNGKRWQDKMTHRSLSKALKYAHDIFIARNNNMLRNNYNLEEAKQ